MGMFSLSTNEKAKFLINEGYIEIGFSDNDDIINEGFSVKKKGNNKLKVEIRNRKGDGVNGKPIQHPNITVKIIKGDTFMHDGKKGLPLEIEPEIKISKDANNNYNKKNLTKQDLKFATTIINDNKDDIKKYWNLDPDNPEDVLKMKEIQKRINDKYK